MLITNPVPVGLIPLFFTGGGRRGFTGFLGLSSLSRFGMGRRAPGRRCSSFVIRRWRSGARLEPRGLNRRQGGSTRVVTFSWRRRLAPRSEAERTRFCPLSKTWIPSRNRWYGGVINQVIIPSDLLLPDEGSWLSGGYGILRPGSPFNTAGIRRRPAINPRSYAVIDTGNTRGREVLSRPLEFCRQAEGIKASVGITSWPFPKAF